MRLDSWIGIALHHRRVTILAALITTFAGVSLVIDRPKGAIIEWLALPLIVAGGSLLTWAVWPEIRGFNLPAFSMASRLLERLTFRGQLVPLFPVIGVAIILSDFGYNLVLSATPAIQTEDTIVLLAAGFLLGYRFVPIRFARERDFVLLFFLFLNAILVLPLLVARVYFADLERSVDLYSWTALAPETSAVLQLLGVPNTVHAVAGSTAPGLTFTLERVPIEVTVVITTACSGIYSFGIFASAFIAFTLTEFSHPSRRVWLLLGFGLLAAYIANILRMVIIVLIGYYTDSGQTNLQNMLLAHSYAGWLIFLAWISLFWTVLFKFLRPAQRLPVVIENSTKLRAGEPVCETCDRPLGPAFPALRCDCGSYYHRACLQGRQCPRCGRLQASDSGGNWSAT